jgi:HK97 family phage major capsid protein
MPNRLFERLSGDYRTLTEQYEEILNRCADEGRDPSEAEAGTLDELRSEMGPLGDRLIELRESDERRFGALRAMSEMPELPPMEPTGMPVVHVRAEPATYRRDTYDRSFFADLFDAQVANDVEARARLDRHDLEVRAAATTVTGAGTVPPNWLIEEYAPLAHGARPWADTIRGVPIEDARPVTIGVSIEPAAQVTNQAGENTPPQDGDFTSVPIVAVPQTKTGKVDVSRQLLDGSNPMVDGLIYGDLMGAYAENIEQMVVAALNGLAAATIAGNFPIDLATDQIPDGVIDAGVAVRTQRHMAPNVLFCSEAAWGTICKQKDSAGRPLVVTGYHGPQNARGLGEALVYGHVAGELVGMQVIPSWAATDSQMYVVKADDLLLLESTTMTFRYEEVLGPQTIRLGVWGYAVPQLLRYPKAIARITTTGVLPFAHEAPEHPNAHDPKGSK